MQNQMMCQTPVNALLASHTGAATLGTKIDMQLTESICTLAESVLAGASSLATLPMSMQDTTYLLGPAIVILILLQRATTKLPEGSRRRNHWQPYYVPGTSLHGVIDL